MLAGGRPARDNSDSRTCCCAVACSSTMTDRVVCVLSSSVSVNCGEMCPLHQARSPRGTVEILVYGCTCEMVCCRCTIRSVDSTFSFSSVATCQTRDSARWA